MRSFKYIEPTSLLEATKLLKKYGSAAMILAGGTDLINQMEKGKYSPEVVIQIRKIAELSTNMEFRADGIVIGALTTLSEIADDKRVLSRFPALAEAVSKIGSKQIRNRATIVGNVCNASPAADSVPALLVHDAVVNIVTSDNNKRSVPLSSFIAGPGKPLLENTEIVESIFVPSPPELSSSTYLKLSRRDGVDLATVGVAAYADKSHTVKLAFGAVGPRAFRAYKAETFLKEASLDSRDMEFGIQQAISEASPITDLRGSSEYRLAMIETLARRAIRAAFDRIGMKG